MFEVLSTSGDTHLGGDDFDKRIVDFLADDFKSNEGMDLRKDRQALQRLTEAAEKAKMELSSTPQTSISLPFITATADGPKHIESTLTRSKFEQICSDLLDRCRIPVEQALKDAKLNLSEINEVSLCTMRPEGTSTSASRVHLKALQNLTVLSLQVLTQHGSIS